MAPEHLGRCSLWDHRSSWLPDGFGSQLTQPDSKTIVPLIGCMDNSATVEFEITGINPSSTGQLGNIVVAALWKISAVRIQFGFINPFHRTWDNKAIGLRNCIRGSFRLRRFPVPKTIVPNFKVMNLNHYRTSVEWLTTLSTMWECLGV